MDDLREKYLALIEDAATLDALAEVQAGALGKSGEVGQRMRELGKMPPEERQAAAARFNALKGELGKAIAARRDVLEDGALAAERVDVTLPGRNRHVGTLHPVVQSAEDIVLLLADLDFVPVGDPLASSILGGDVAPTIFSLANPRASLSGLDENGAYRVECVAKDGDLTLAHARGLAQEVIAAFLESEAPDLRLRPAGSRWLAPAISFEMALENGWSGLAVGGVIRSDASSDQAIACSFDVIALAALKYGFAPEQWNETDHRWLRHFGLSAMETGSVFGGLSR